MPLPTPTAPTEFRIVGYVTDGETVISQIQFDKLTHINYAFVLPNEDGTFETIANPWKLEEVVKQAHRRGVKVLISVGGWGFDPEFEQLAAAPETRARLVEGLMAFVEQYDLDGVDIDWEYPGPEPESAANFVQLMAELDARLQPQGKLLTAAVVAVGATGEGVRADVFERVDFLNLMAYDGSEGHHSSYEYAETALNYWSARGLPREKMVLGVPFYSRPTLVTYRKIIQADPQAAQADEWTYHGSTVYYNGLATMQRKTELAMQRASGIMIWTLAYDTSDDTSLLNAIHQTAHGRAAP